MRHLEAGRKLGVGHSHRKAMLRNLTLTLIEHETIKTLVPRAKELRMYADRVITLAKQGDVAGRRQLVKMLGSTQTFTPGENRVRMAIEHVYEVLVPRFKDRQGGYTQLLRISQRRKGDNATICVLRYLPDPAEDKKGKKGKSEKASKKEAKGADDKPAKKAKTEKPAEKKSEPSDREGKPAKKATKADKE